MDSQFHRILALVRRTGDRMVVTDQNGKDVYVIMGLDQYEDLLNDVDFVDDETWGDRQINDAEIWSDVSSDDIKPFEPSVPSASLEPSVPPRNIFDAMPPAGSKAETWDVSKMNQQELEQVKYAHEQSKRPSAPLEPHAPSAPSTPQDASEDQYYLEPIE